MVKVWLLTVPLSEGFLVTPQEKVWSKEGLGPFYSAVQSDFVARITTKIFGDDKRTGLLRFDGVVNLVWGKNDPNDVFYYHGLK